MESDALKRDFILSDGLFYTSQILNKLSGMSLVPDGSGSEFEICFTDGDSISSKSLKVEKHAEKGGRLFFKFEEACDTAVTLSYRVSANKKYIEKQLTLKQSKEKTIDCIILENIGIINSSSYYSVPEFEDDNVSRSLGQPFYIDSLFFGCEFPATRNKIFHSRGQIIYYLGKSATETLVCPATVIGAAKSHLLVDLKEAFFEYINSISIKRDFNVNYNTWLDRKMNVDTDNAQKSFYTVENMLTSHGVQPIDNYVIDDGWNNYKGGFWAYNQKKFPNGFLNASQCAKSLGSSLGLWLSPRGGYDFYKKFAKNIEKAKMGYYNAEAEDICIGSKKYIENLEKFILKTTQENDIGYWKFDGFCWKACRNAQHDHIVGGENDMYYITEMWQGYIKIFKAMRALREKQGKKLFINMTCYVNPSPWWLQYVNTVWIQDCLDIGFADNYASTAQSRLDSMLTYRDSTYYHFMSRRGYQFPADAIFNHEPIYAREAGFTLSDDEFELMLYWNACRGSSLAEFYLSESMMNEEKWQRLANVIEWQRKNFSILKNAMFLGGDPAKNNIYCYASWDKAGNGIVALRNPSNESAALTLTLNKLMGCPETLSGAKRFNIYNKTGGESNDTYKYNDKINLTLNPFEIKIFQFAKKAPAKEDGEANDFTISFESSGNNGVICQNNDVFISIENGYINAYVGALKLKSESIISSSHHKIMLVREKNKMVKLYIDNFLDCSAYDKRSKALLSTDLKSSATNFSVTDKATPYNKIIAIAELLKVKRTK
ncbi:MAG: hypothetical protein LUH82_02440 [Clostridiales bacterium]|nr:hypothetical protein [Clostridiales bacterium]